MEEAPPASCPHLPPVPPAAVLLLVVRRRVPVVTIATTTTTAPATAITTASEIRPRTRPVTRRWGAPVVPSAPVPHPQVHRADAPVAPHAVTPRAVAAGVIAVTVVLPSLFMLLVLLIHLRYLEMRCKDTIQAGQRRTWK